MHRRDLTEAAAAGHPRRQIELRQYLTQPIARHSALAGPVVDQIESVAFRVLVLRVKGDVEQPAPEPSRADLYDVCAAYGNIRKLVVGQYGHFVRKDGHVL